ncbi:MAG: ABC transporter substrate-binding protein, partial [Variovorax sp.]
MWLQGCNQLLLAPMIKPGRHNRRFFATAITLLTFGCPPAALAQAKPPIKVGAISSTQFFPESTAAVRAYFNVLNANGGIQGRQLQLITEDDRGDAGAAGRFAKRLAEVEGVVANVGSA